MSESSQQRKIILFDFDGVIADSFTSAFEVSKILYPHITENDFRRRFEENINNWNGPTHTDDCGKNIDFFEKYIPKMKKMKVIPGILEVIKNLSHNYTLIIISSTITGPIREFMEQHKIAQYFTEIMGNDIHISKVTKIKMVFLKYKTSSKECLFITDTLGDIKEATQVGVNTIGIVWGFQDKRTITKGKPIAIAEKPEELLSIISDYFEKPINQNNQIK